MKTKRADTAIKRAGDWKRSAGELVEDNEAKQNTIDNLNDQIGQRNMWRTVKAIPWILDIFEPSKVMWQVVGKKLTALGKELGMPPEEIPDVEYGTVKKHHVDIIEAFRCKLIADPRMLGKYRKD